MVIFHKYEVRVSPGTSPSLTLYAPDRVSLEQNADYRQLVGDNRPCRLQLADTHRYGITTVRITEMQRKKKSLIG